ncbi:MAG: bifunctional 3-deoxy-7-phosphoheptulonate synthase/chorismate mutase type II [Muribaculaceae bacterium]|nr:bifunctional 3-deoxy-7-phosphoheptulonate synthase/chorismate mutase type II [Muribaculaceae bacterium]
MNLLPFLSEKFLKTRPLVIAGPCSAESPEQMMCTAAGLAALGVGILRAGVWKPRTMPGCFEGFGSVALEWLVDAAKKYHMLSATEVATRGHVEEALGSGVDILWIGARTTANPFAVQEIADTVAAISPDTPVIVKNPVNPDIALWLGAMQRLSRAGVCRLAASHRGFSVYEPGIFRNAPCWRLPIELRRQLPELPLLCDPSHIAGRRDLVAPICQQAMDLGFDGLIVECHCSPDEALSDAAQQLTPADFGVLLNSLRLKEGDGNHLESLSQMRGEIDAIDSEIINLLARRMDVARRIGDYKRAQGLPVIQSERYSQLIDQRTAQACALNLDDAFIRGILEAIHEESVRLQLS